MGSHLPGVSQESSLLDGVLWDGMDHGSRSGFTGHYSEQVSESTRQDNSPAGLGGGEKQQGGLLAGSASPRD